MVRPLLRGLGGRTGGRALGLGGLGGHGGGPEPSGRSRGVTRETRGAAARRLPTWRRSEGECLVLWPGRAGRGRGLVVVDGAPCPDPPCVSGPAPGDGGRIVRAAARVDEHGPLTRSCPEENARCARLSSPGSWLRKPPPATHGCFVPVSDVCGGPPKTVPTATWADA